MPGWILLNDGLAVPTSALAFGVERSRSRVLTGLHLGTRLPLIPLHFPSHLHLLKGD